MGIGWQTRFQKSFIKAIYPVVDTGFYLIGNEMIIEFRSAHASNIPNLKNNSNPYSKNHHDTPIALIY
jgi:hypothetical protein